MMNEPDTQKSRQDNLSASKVTNLLEDNPYVINMNKA